MREAAEKQIQLKKPKEEPVSSPAVEEEEVSSDEEMTDEEIAKILAAAKKVKKAKKVAEKSAAEKEEQRLLLEEEWKTSVGFAEKEKKFLAMKEEMDALILSNPHKKKITLTIGKNRVSAEENPEKRAALDKRKALNNGDEVSKKNLFCPNGDGVNGEKEYKAGGIKINGCSYCCRSQTTMDKHIKMCKKIKYQYK